MSDDNNEFEKRSYKRLQEELRELETPQAQGQAVLDRMWSQQRAAEAEERRIKRQLDPYGLGLYDPP
jgi:hypothetical protein